jgi:alpha-beta hydrolase superfamily lysophospholipase
LVAEAAAVSGGFVESADGTRLAYRSWPSSGAAITFAVVHGLGEHSGRYERFAHGMAKHGIATYAVDLRGHGQSPGPRGHIDSWSQWTDDIAAFVRHVGELATGEVVPLGHSFGGAAMLSTVLAGKLPDSKRFVVSSPALRLKVEVPGLQQSAARLASRLAPRLMLGNNVNPGTISRIPEVVEAYGTDPLVHSKISARMYTEWQDAAADILVRAGEIRIPFLILAGSDDRLIDAQGSKHLHQRSPVSELRMLDGRFHEPFNDLGSDEVFELIAHWLNAS